MDKSLSLDEIVDYLQQRYAGDPDMQDREYVKLVAQDFAVGSPQYPGGFKTTEELKQTLDYLEELGRLLFLTQEHRKRLGME